MSTTFCACGKYQFFFDMKLPEGHHLDGECVEYHEDYDDWWDWWEKENQTMVWDKSFSPEQDIIRRVKDLLNNSTYLESDYLDAYELGYIDAIGDVLKLLGEE